MARQRPGAAEGRDRCAATGIAEPVDVLEDGRLGLAARFPSPAPDQLGLDGLEEGLDGRIVVAVAFAGHGDAHAMSIEFGLIVDRAILLEFKRSSQYRFQSFLWLRQKPQPAFASLMFSLVGC